MHHPVSPCPSPSLRPRHIHHEEPVIIENWRKEKTLGSGAFGVITLWKNCKTHEYIAIKQCRYCVTPSGIPNGPLLISKQQRERWKHEVDLMRRLNHPNVVKSVAVPACLEPQIPQPLPSLGMEYCSGGDLRQVLNKPEHCCGLPERSVRLILRQIASALLYLHSERIIHRDVKPENIVLKLESNGTVTYKIIDLGYCKELDQSSMASSFVGTMQYLAPELFENKSYTAAVDNWSFGLLTHEIITGKRPFAPNSTPAQWLPIVRDKKPEAIGATLDTNSGNVTYHKTISPFNHVTCVFKCDLESWLQVVLQKDPEKRGGKKAFESIESILNKKVIKIFSVPGLQLFTYQMTPNIKILDLKLLIKRDTPFDCKDQLLLIPSDPRVRPRSLLISGDSLDQTSVTDCLASRSNQDCEADTIYLFHRSHALSFTQYSVTSLIPPSEESVLLHPTNLVTFQDHKSTAGNFVWVAQELIQKLNRLTNAHQALINYCIQLHHTVRDKEMTATHDACKLSETAKLLEKYVSMLREHLSRSMDILSKMKVQSVEKECNKFLSQAAQVEQVTKSLEQYSKKFNDQFISLIESTTKCTIDNIFDPFSPKINKQCDQLFITYSNIVQAFEDIRYTTRDDRIAKTKLANSQAAFDNTQLVKLICDLFQLAEKTVKSRYSEMNRLLELSATANTIGKNFRQITVSAETQYKQLESAHQSLIDSQWSLFDDHVAASSSPSHSNGSHRQSPSLQVNQLNDQLDKLRLQSNSASSLNTASLTLNHHD